MSALSIAEVLEKAADLIEPEGRWTQGAYARDALGETLSGGRRAAARCWCLVGALEAASGKMVGRALIAPIYEAIADSRLTLVTFNDAPGRTQAEVVAKLREAAALARREGR